MSLRIFVPVALAAALLLPATASIASPAPTGTVVGTVTCGPAEDDAAAQALISVEGMDVSTSADTAGKFTLVVPAGQMVTIDATADQSGSVVSSRYDVPVQPGAVIDIGNLDLAACPQPQPAVPSPATDLPSEFPD